MIMLNETLPPSKKISGPYNMDHLYHYSQFLLISIFLVEHLVI